MLKICAIDLDGAICAYPQAWVDFVNEKVKKNYPNLNQIKNSLSFNYYKKLKLEYRTSGIKANLPKIEGATELVRRLRKAGYIIIILTARPFYKIPEVMRDTLFWLRHNKISYDLIFTGEDKHIQIIKYFPKLKFMIEDNAQIANKVAGLGYKVYLLDNIYNQQKIVKGVVRIKKLKEVRE